MERYFAPFSDFIWNNPIKTFLYSNLTRGNSIKAINPPTINGERILITYLIPLIVE